MWRLVTSGALTGPILGPLSQPYQLIECTHSKFAGLFIRKLGGVAGSRAAIQRDLHRLEMGAGRNLVELGKEK